ncbi:hypothetical protein PM3016_6620 [Paenibacillus mucilaginosus 3016]|uniref:Uncharacterized protein n=1 Tax=Paenibacillus mucilaginosus 3016 TaxID=1116391 RepID=H6NM73_9BACL|nr:hypothetical protein [Paenibacillus mucilaginosus]AFC33235.1 hypothetical protein PM3016_6620 [Paenibacillus mucilaginosus 3016]WFA22782.1 hypothetical protein ERY13_32895 [Paenibacillus mucilaginosus]
MLTLFTWPLVILSVPLALIGLILRSPALLYAAALCIVPTFLYLAMTPRFLGWGLLFPFGYTGAGWLLMRKAPLWASSLPVLPVCCLFGWLGYIIWQQ